MNVSYFSQEILEDFYKESASETTIDKPLLITNWKFENVDSSYETACHHQKLKLIIKWFVQKLKGVQTQKRPTYLEKLKGAGVSKPPKEPIIETVLTVFGAFVSTLVITILDYFVLRPNGYIFTIAPFAAMATIMFYYHSYKSPFSQPRNTLFANIMAALVAVGIRKLVKDEFLWLGSSLAVSLAIALMVLTNTVNPPAGATAMTVFYGDPLVSQEGFMFILIPTAVGTCLFIIMVILINNLSPRRRYPTFWFY